MATRRISHSLRVAVWADRGRPASVHSALQILDEGAREGAFIVLSTVFDVVEPARQVAHADEIGLLRTATLLNAAGAGTFAPCLAAVGPKRMG